MMSTTHYTGAGGYLDHGDAAELFPADELSAVVHQHRDAQVELESVGSEDILAVAPTGLASSYYLNGHPLTIVEIDSLSDRIEASITAESDVDVSEYEMIRIGTGPSQITDRSLAEF